MAALQHPWVWGALRPPLPWAAGRVHPYPLFLPQAQGKAEEDAEAEEDGRAGRQSARLLGSSFSWYKVSARSGAWNGKLLQPPGPHRDLCGASRGRVCPGPWPLLGPSSELGLQGLRLGLPVQKRGSKKVASVEEGDGDLDSAGSQSRGSVSVGRGNLLPPRGACRRPLDSRPALSPVHLLPFPPPTPWVTCGVPCPDTAPCPQDNEAEEDHEAVAGALGPGQVHQVRGRPRRGDAG